MTDTIGDLLRFDPLAEAERVTGKDYKVDEATVGLGMLLGVDNGDRKRAALTATNDTHWGVTFSEALGIFESEGFGVVYDEPFKGTSSEAPTERYVILWNPLGILITAESYGGNRSLNSAKMQYAVRFTEGVKAPWELRSSGRFHNFDTDPIWAGDHDIREGFRYKLHGLRDNGTFVNPWPEKPFLWFKNYADKREDYKAATEAVIASLPASVQACIAGEATMDAGRES